jgi:N-acetylmuramoyl-L-alanine amidase
MDLASRLSTAVHTEGGLFISIHMNAFPQSQYHGLQVWYGTGDPLSAEIATAIQGQVRTLLQPDNARRTKAATDAIYLLKKLESPAVLVECGFLSNPEEAARLSEAEYQQKLAFAIFSAIISYLE